MELSDLTCKRSLNSLVLACSSLLVLDLVKALLRYGCVLAVIELIKVYHVEVMPCLPSNSLNALVKPFNKAELWSEVLSLCWSLGLTNLVWSVEDSSLSPLVNLSFTVLKDLSQRELDISPILMEGLFSYRNHSKFALCPHNLNVVYLVS